MTAQKKAKQKVAPATKAPATKAKPAPKLTAADQASLAPKKPVKAPKQKQVNDVAVDLSIVTVALVQAKRQYEMELAANINLSADNYKLKQQNEDMAEAIVNLDEAVLDYSRTVGYYQDMVARFKALNIVQRIRVAASLKWPEEV